MSLFNMLNIGASGMGAATQKLHVIGDNVANIGTTGFKAGRATFGDMLPDVRAGIGGMVTFGMGAKLHTITTAFTQGNVIDTTSALDVALVGNGFFQMRDERDMFYSRDGSFHVDKDSYIVNSSGMRLQGFSVINNVVTTVADDIRLNLDPITHTESTAITIDTVLSADADFTTTPYAALTKDGVTTTIEDMSLEADFSNSVVVYDSMGVSHDVTIFYERTSGTTWDWSAVVDGGEVDTSGDGTPDGLAGYGFEVASGELTFDATGELINLSQTDVPGWQFAGGTGPFAFTLEAGMDASGLVTDGMLRMSGGVSATTAISQNGFRAANLLAIRVEQDGRVISTYENGQELNLGQIAVATFPSQDGIQRIGDNLYRETEISGDVALGVPGTGGRARTQGYGLENSNVELEDEFVNMIQAQRAYQSNTGVIRTANDTLQQLIGLV
jgi:flagellar hook protein FlgE